MPWNVVLLIETERVSLALRRYSTDRRAPCPAEYYHEAHTQIGMARLTFDAEGNWEIDAPQPDPNDPRWPTQCACGYVFTEADNRQLAPNRIYTRQDTGAEITLDEAEPGMVWEAPYYADVGWHGVDGRSFVMRLPANDEWAIDAVSTSGGRWERTGEPPNITVRPSILSKHYHGWVTDGVLSDDLEGRTY